jgi:hypothetical protein
MSANLKVSSWVGIRQGCPIRYRVNASDDVEFAVGGIRECFEFVFDAEALREFLRLGAEALQEMEARQAQEEAAEHEATGNTGKRASLTGTEPSA